MKGEKTGGETRGEGMRGDKRERECAQVLPLTIQVTVSSVELVSTNDEIVGASGTVDRMTTGSVYHSNTTQHVKYNYVHVQSMWMDITF